VQKGKLAAAALPFSTMALKRVDCSSSGDKGGQLVRQGKKQHADVCSVVWVAGFDVALCC
jgi:hypothetical protein